MNDYKVKYEKELENELKQFLLLCGKTDARVLLSQAKKTSYTDYSRLACICLVFGYKKLFLKIAALAEKNIDCFLKELDILKGNFTQVDKWVTDFIENISLPEIQELSSEFWQNKKETIDRNNFHINQLL